jgi:hypothetical protein
VFKAATPSPMWEMFLLAAKFLYANTTFILLSPVGVPLPPEA